LGHALGDIPEGHRHTVAQALADGAQPAATYYVMITLACVIATAGLVTDSTAVVIGAMLVSPLMGPIVGLAAGIVAGQGRTVGQALLTLVSGAGFAVLAAISMTTIVVQWAPDLLTELPREVVARTRPTLFDLAIALVGGLAGAYATVHPRLSTALPGVAIATALMPPLCTVGILLTLGETEAARGAFLLFLANFAAISTAAALVLYGLGFWREARESQQGAKLVRRGLLVSVAFLGIIAVPLAGITLGMVQERHDERQLRSIVEEALRAALPPEAAPEARIARIERQDMPNSTQLRVLVMSPAHPDRSIMRVAQEAVAAYLQRPVQLSVLVSPVTRLDAVTPVAATPPSTSARVLAAVGVRPDRGTQPRPTLALPSATPLPTSTLVPTAQATPTLAPTLAPTATSITVVPTAQPTSTPQTWVAVALTDGDGAFQRSAPGTDAPVISGWPDGTPFLATGRIDETSGLRWREVAAPDGRVGWIAEVYLVPYRPDVGGR